MDDLSSYTHSITYLGTIPVHTTHLDPPEMTNLHAFTYMKFGGYVVAMWWHHGGSLTLKTNQHYRSNVPTTHLDI